MPLLQRSISLLLAAALCLAATPPAAQAQIFELPAPTPRHASFGETVALEGQRALVGAPGETGCPADTARSEAVDASAADTSAANAGAVYVFERGADRRGWQQAARLVPGDCRAGAFFGRAVALSGDRLLVGASDEFFADERSNVAYVFERGPDGAWREAAQLTVDPAQDRGTFAAAVALDGNRALVTTQGDPKSETGHSTGAAYIFERTAEGRWAQAARLRGAGGPQRSVFGGTAALQNDRALVTASTYLDDAPGSAYLYERSGDTWQQVARFDGIDDFFIAVALDEDYALIGESRAGGDDEGAATLFAQESGEWKSSATLRPRTPYELGGFGNAVSLGGGRALVTGYDEQLGFDDRIDRVVYVFARDTRGRWQQRQVIDIGEVGFGAALAHDGRWAIVSRVQPGRPGTAYIVRLH